MTTETRIPQAPPLTGIKKDVLEVVMRHVGQENAIMAMDLAEAVGLPRTKAATRKVGLVVRDLRHLHKPVLSQCVPPYGYYWPGNREEGDKCLSSMKSRLCEDALTRSDIKVGLGLYWAQAEKMKFEGF